MKISGKDNPGEEEVIGGTEEVVQEGMYGLVGKKNAPHRLLLTTSEIIVQDARRRSVVDRYDLNDLFGCQTLRKVRREGPEVGYSEAYICFYLYPRRRPRGLFSSNKKTFRTRLTLVFQVNEMGKNYQDNLEVATKWKTLTYALLHAKFPKWQNKAGVTGSNNNEEAGGGFDVELEGMSLTGTKDSTEAVTALSALDPYIRRFLVILNPKSGQGKTLSIFNNKVGPVLREAGVRMEMLVTDHPGHARNLMTSCDLSEVDGIVTIGGDGILYEVVNGLRGRADASRLVNIPLGIIAGGSGNGLARSIADYSGDGDDYLKNPVQASALAVARAQVTKVNLAEVEVDGARVYSFLSVGWGLMADIDVESEVLRALGEGRFTIWSFYRLATLKSYKATLSYIPHDCPTDEGRVVVESEFIVIYSAIQSYIGSDIIFAPTATRNDGLIHLIYLTKSVGRANTTRFLLNIDNGSHVEVAGVNYTKVREYTMEAPEGLKGHLTIDGEVANAKKVTVRVADIPLNVFTM